jgi:uncharacterized protein
VDKENRDAVPEFLSLCGDTFKSDERFKIFIRPLSRLGGSNDEKLRPLDGGMDCEEISELRKMAQGRGLVQSGKEMPLQMCYASKANSFVVRADGRINKCTVALEHPENQVGLLNEDGILTLEKERMLKWMRGLHSQDEKELRCPLQNFPVDQ